MVLPRATAGHCCPIFLPDSCPSRALPAASAAHPAKTAKLNETSSRFPLVAQFRTSLFSTFRRPISTCHPSKRTVCGYAQLAPFVPLTFLQNLPSQWPYEPGDFDRAWEVLQDAYQAQMEGDYDRAAELYQSSLELIPPPKRTPFSAGPTISRAAFWRLFSECKRAIELDPDFGNPYNDIALT